MARRHATNPRFSFGSGKFGDLAAFSSALILGIISLGIATESVMRLYARSRFSTSRRFWWQRSASRSTL